MTTEPEKLKPKSSVEQMFDDITTDMLLPLIKLSDSGELPVRAEHWQLLTTHIKQQVAELYFGTHCRLPEAKD